MFTSVKSGKYTVDDHVKRVEQKRKNFGALQLDSEFKTMTRELNESIKDGKDVVVGIATMRGNGMFEFYFGDIDSGKAISGYVYRDEFSEDTNHLSRDMSPLIRTGSLILPLKTLSKLFDFKNKKVYCNKEIMYNIFLEADIQVREIVDIGFHTNHVPVKGGKPCLSCVLSPQSCAARIGSVLSTIIASGCADSCMSSSPPWNEFGLEVSGAFTDAWQSSFATALDQVCSWYSRRIPSIADKISEILEMTPEKAVEECKLVAPAIDPMDLVSFHDIYLQEFTEESAVYREDIWEKSEALPGEQDCLSFQVGRVMGRAMVTRAGNMKV